MPTAFGSENVKCPFYDEETKNSIKCEGAFSKTCNQNFDNSETKKKYKEKYCNKDYNNCSHYKQVNSKYP